MTTTSAPTRPAPTRTELESSIEAYLVKRVRELGGMTNKIAPTERGLPDRMVILPGCGVQLVELKAVGGRVSPLQRVWHDRAQEMGVTVYVIEGRAQVDQWLHRMIKAADALRRDEFAALRRTRGGL